jgi:hypothetical protein
MIIKLKLHGGNISHWDVYIMRVTMSVLPRKKKNEYAKQYGISRI